MKYHTDGRYMNRASSSLLALLLLLNLPASSRAEFLHPDVKIGGKSQASLSAEWSQWAMRYPASVSPVFDTTGEHSGTGNQGDIFFLAGAIDGTPITRTVTIGTNHTLFFPVLQSLALEGIDGAEEDLIDLAEEKLGKVGDLLAWVRRSDGAMTIPQLYLTTYRQTAGLFDVNLPNGEVRLGASDGLWLALEPLEVGTYELRIRGRGVGQERYQDEVYSRNINYRITVVTPEPGALLLAMLGLGLGWVRRR